MGQRMPRCLVKHYFWEWLWRCFCKRLALKLVKWLKQMALPNVGGHNQIPWESEQKKRWKKAEFALRLAVWAGTLIWSCLQCSWFSGLQTRTRIYSTGSPALSPPHYPPTFPGLQLADSGCGTAVFLCFSLSPCVYFYVIYIYIYDIWYI